MTNELKINDMIQLIPISNHGKNKINQHGNMWRIVGIINNDKIMVESEHPTFINKNIKSHDMRWVDINNDKDFKLEK